MNQLPTSTADLPFGTLEHLRGSKLAVRAFGGSDPSVFGALETVTPADKYDWHGLKRRIDPAHPRIVFQCTLSGWGAYEENGVTSIVGPGQALCAIVPSAHRYYLPKDSSIWTFVWAIIMHPYVVSRIMDRRRHLPAVMSVSADSALFGRLIRLLDISRAAVDRFALEQATFNFLIEFERLADSLLYSEPERERLLAQVRSQALTNLSRRIDVDLLAVKANMSRSHYAHYFKSVVGIPPGQYLTQLRLDEATRLLTEGGLKLESVAAATGFANANHFCKVFRRHFHISPGEFRRQIAG